MDIPALPVTAAARDLRALAEQLPLLVWMTDASGRFIYLNPNARALAPGLGEVYAKDWNALIHPDDQRMISEKFAHAADRHEEYQVEYRIARADGTVRWLLESGAPRFDADGSFAGFAGSTMDVSARREAEQRLAHSEAAYRLLAEHASDMISHHAMDGTYLFASPAIRQMIGVDPEQRIGRNALEYIHEDDQHIVCEALAQVATTGRLQAPIEFRVLHDEGHYIWVGTSARAIVDPASGKATALVAVTRNITAERNAKERMQKQEQMFRNLMELSSDWYWETDTEARFTFISEGVRDTLGIGVDEVLGKQPADLVADSTQPGFIAYRQHLARREPFRGLQVANIAPHGRQYVVSLSGEPVFEQGQFRGFRGVASDVTVQVEHTHKLAQLADENRSVIEQALDMKLLVDTNGIILRANGAAQDISGYLPQELVGKPYHRFIAPADRERSTEAVKRIKPGRIALRDFENRWVRKDGSEVELLWSATWSADGARAYCTGRDVTERNRNRKALQRSNDKLNRVLESIGDGFFTLDQRWRVEYANEMAAGFFGREREELIGRTLWSAAPQLLESSLMPHLRRAMERREPASFEAYYEPRRAWLDMRVYAHEEGMSVFFHDASARHQAATALWLSEQRFREVVEMNPAGYLLVDGAGRLTEVNRALSELSGFSQEELLGMTIGQLLADDAFSTRVQQGALEPQVHGRESALRHKLGDDVHVLLNASAQFDGDNRLLSVTAFVTDITARKRAELELKQQATHDPLTGLPNRIFLEEQLPSILNFAARGQVNAVLLVDLDGFKRVNDTLGHAAGDALLCEVAHRLRRHTREGDIVARLGGDEFVLVAHCADGTRSAEGMAAQLIESLRAPIDVGQQQVLIGASIGISLSPQDGTTRDELFAHADAAMYRAKAAGRNRYCFSSAAPDPQAGPPAG